MYTTNSYNSRKKNIWAKHGPPKEEKKVLSSLSSAPIMGKGLDLKMLSLIHGEAFIGGTWLEGSHTDQTLDFYIDLFTFWEKNPHVAFNHSLSPKEIREIKDNLKQALTALNFLKTDIHKLLQFIKEVLFKQKRPHFFLPLSTQGHAFCAVFSLQGEQMVAQLMNRGEGANEHPLLFASYSKEKRSYLSYAYVFDAKDFYPTSPFAFAFFDKISQYATRTKGLKELKYSSDEVYHHFVLCAKSTHKKDLQEEDVVSNQISGTCTKQVPTFITRHTLRFWNKQHLRKPVEYALRCQTLLEIYHKFLTKNTLEEGSLYVLEHSIEGLAKWSCDLLEANLIDAQEYKNTLQLLNTLELEVVIPLKAQHRFALSLDNKMTQKLSTRHALPPIKVPQAPSSTFSSSKRPDFVPLTLVRPHPSNLTAYLETFNSHILHFDDNPRYQLEVAYQALLVLPVPSHENDTYWSKIPKKHIERCSKALLKLMTLHWHLFAISSVPPEFNYQLQIGQYLAYAGIYKLGCRVSLLKLDKFNIASSLPFERRSPRNSGGFIELPKEEKKYKELIKYFKTFSEPSKKKLFDYDPNVDQFGDPQDFFTLKNEVAYLDNPDDHDLRYKISFGFVDMLHYFLDIAPGISPKKLTSPQDFKDFWTNTLPKKAPFFCILQQAALLATGQHAITPQYFTKKTCFFELEVVQRGFSSSLFFEWKETNWLSHPFSLSNLKKMTKIGKNHGYFPLPDEFDETLFLDNYALAFRQENSLAFHTPSIKALQKTKEMEIWDTKHVGRALLQLQVDSHVTLCLSSTLDWMLKNLSLLNEKAVQQELFFYLMDTRQLALAIENEPLLIDSLHHVLEKVIIRFCPSKSHADTTLFWMKTAFLLELRLLQLSKYVPKTNYIQGIRDHLDRLHQTVENQKNAAAIKSKICLYQVFTFVHCQRLSNQEVVYLLQKYLEAKKLEKSLKNKEIQQLTPYQKRAEQVVILHSKKLKRALKNKHLREKALSPVAVGAWEGVYPYFTCEEAYIDFYKGVVKAPTIGGKTVSMGQAPFSSHFQLQLLQQYGITYFDSLQEAGEWYITTDGSYQIKEPLVRKKIHNTYCCSIDYKLPFLASDSSKEEESETPHSTNAPFLFWQGIEKGKPVVYIEYFPPYDNWGENLDKKTTPILFAKCVADHKQRIEKVDNQGKGQRLYLSLPKKNHSLYPFLSYLSKEPHNPLKCAVWANKNGVLARIELPEHNVSLKVATHRDSYHISLEEFPTFYLESLQNTQNEFELPKALVFRNAWGERKVVLLEEKFHPKAKSKLSYDLEIESTTVKSTSYATVKGQALFFTVNSKTGRLVGETPHATLYLISLYAAQGKVVLAKEYLDLLNPLAPYGESELALLDYLTETLTIPNPHLSPFLVHLSLHLLEVLNRFDSHTLFAAARHLSSIVSSFFAKLEPHIRYLFSKGGLVTRRSPEDLRLTVHHIEQLITASKDVRPTWCLIRVLYLLWKANKKPFALETTPHKKVIDTRVSMDILESLEGKKASKMNPKKIRGNTSFTVTNFCEVYQIILQAAKNDRRIARMYVANLIRRYKKQRVLIEFSDGFNAHVLLPILALVADYPNYFSLKSNLHSIIENYNSCRSNYKIEDAPCLSFYYTEKSKNKSLVRIPKASTVKTEKSAIFRKIVRKDITNQLKETLEVIDKVHRGITNATSAKNAIEKIKVIEKFVEEQLIPVVDSLFAYKKNPLKIYTKQSQAQLKNLFTAFLNGSTSYAKGMSKQNTYQFFKTLLRQLRAPSTGDEFSTSEKMTHALQAFSENINNFLLEYALSEGNKKDPFQDAPSIIFEKLVSKIATFKETLIQLCYEIDPLFVLAFEADFKKPLREKKSVIDVLLSHISLPPLRKALLALLEKPRGAIGKIATPSKDQSFPLQALTHYFTVKTIPLPHHPFALSTFASSKGYTLDGSAHFLLDSLSKAHDATKSSTILFTLKTPAIGHPESEVEEEAPTLHTLLADTEIALKKKRAALESLANQGLETDESHAFLVDEIHMKRFCKQLYYIDFHKHIWPAFLEQNPGLLKKNNPLLTEEDIEEIFALFIDYLLLSSKKDQLLNALEEYHKWETSNDTLEKHHYVQELGKIIHKQRSYDPKKFPEFLLYEYASGFILRPEQVDLLKTVFACTSAKEQQELLVEFQAGGGKTKVISVIIMLQAIRRGKLPIFYSPPTLLSITKEDLKNSLFLFFQKKIRVLDISLKTDLSSDNTLPALLANLAKWQREGSVLIISPVTFHALNIYAQKVLVQNIRDTKNSLSPIFSILHFLKENSLAIIDEAHQAVNSLWEANISSGSPIYHTREEQELFMFFFDAILGQLPTGEIIYLENKKPLHEVIALCTQQSTQLQPKDLNSAILALARFFVTTLKVDPSTDSFEILVDYLSNIKTPYPVPFPLEDEALIEKVLLARGLLTQVLPLTLSLMGSFDHGASIRDGDDVESSYAAGEASEEQFELMDVALALSIKGTYQRGLTRHLIKKLFTKIIADHMHALDAGSYSPWADRYNNWVEGLSLPPLANINTMDDALIDTLTQCLGNHRGVIRACLQRIILPQVKQLSLKFKSAGVDLVASSHFSLLFSATLGLAEQYPHLGKLVVQNDFPFAAAVIQRVLTEPKNQNLIVLKQSSPFDFFNHLWKQGSSHFEALEAYVDVGGWTLRFGPQKVAEDFLLFAHKKGLDYEGVLFIADTPTTKQQLQLIKLVAPATKKHPAKFETKPLSGSQNQANGKIFKIYAPNHCTGTDLKLTPKAKVLMPISDTATLYFVIQALMRARRFLAPLIQNGKSCWLQSVLWCVDPQFLKQIDAPNQLKEILPHFFLWALIQEAKKIEEKVIASATQQIQWAVRQFILDLGEVNYLGPNKLNNLKNLEGAFERKITRSLKTLYKDPLTPLPTKKVLNVIKRAYLVECGILQQGEEKKPNPLFQQWKASSYAKQVKFIISRAVKKAPTTSFKSASLSTTAQHQTNQNAQANQQNQHNEQHNANKKLGKYKQRAFSDIKPFVEKKYAESSLTLASTWPQRSAILSNQESDCKREEEDDDFIPTTLSSGPVISVKDPRFLPSSLLSEDLFFLENALITTQEDARVVSENKPLGWLKPQLYFMILFDKSAKRPNVYLTSRSDAVSYSRQLNDCDKAEYKIEHGRRKAIIYTTQGICHCKGEDPLSLSLEDKNTLESSEWFKDLLCEIALINGKVYDYKRLRKKIIGWMRQDRKGFEALWDRIQYIQVERDSVDTDAIEFIIREAHHYIEIAGSDTPLPVKSAPPAISFKEVPPKKREKTKEKEEEEEVSSDSESELPLLENQSPREGDRNPLHKSCDPHTISITTSTPEVTHSPTVEKTNPREKGSSSLAFRTVHVLVVAGSAAILTGVVLALLAGGTATALHFTGIPLMYVIIPSAGGGVFSLILVGGGATSLLTAAKSK